MCVCCKIVYLEDCRLSLGDCDSFVVVICPWMRFALVVSSCPLCFETSQAAYSHNSRGRIRQKHVYVG